MQKITPQQWTVRTILAELASKRLGRRVMPAEVTPDRSLTSLGLTSRGNQVIAKRLEKAALCPPIGSEAGRWQLAGDVMSAVR